MKKYSKLKKLIDFIFSLIYPERCVVCDSLIDYNAGGICKECVGKLRLIGDSRCLKCGKYISNDQLEYCQDCTKISHKFNRGFPLYVYDDNIRKSIYRFKYSNRQRYAIFYGKEIAKNLKQEILAMHAQAIIPVPLHKNKYNKRGYNQAELLADIIGEELGIEVINDFVVRTKNTKPLKTQNPLQRQNNLKKAFKIGRHDVKLTSVVIVDDIYTTGSTIDEIAETLLAEGVKNINFVTLSSGSNI